METLKVITAKEMAETMGISIATANRYLKDIKEEYKIKIVLGQHVNSYFKISAKSK
ncbi:HTH domain-containing protein [Flavobacterium hibisci]|uniref:HTH domain-containing protein n=1 Tax=Flavobacterium hibisci TaxID=1914462 RepID=UPI001CBD8777|nr:HTH domain-containing protein [Flavobacterium hibisci]MBZ4040976.1 HTH domain-containing protein [Flavobacterium hibisci]